MTPIEYIKENELEILLNQKRKTSIQTSSLGRLFDAVSFIAGLGAKNSFEGEGAMKLEALAEHCFKGNFTKPVFHFTFDMNRDVSSHIIEESIEFIRDGGQAQELAAAFHYLLVDMIEAQAMVQKVKDIAFSGGVFQNTLLIDMIHDRLGNIYNLHFHRELSPNDECIAFGQLSLNYITELKEAELSKFETEIL